MRLPFTVDQFLDVFAVYNVRLWPFAAVLWVASAYVVAAFVQGSSSRRLVLGLLAIHWLWAGVAYHLAFFFTINPAALFFGPLFILEGLLLASRGMTRERLQVLGDHSARRQVATALLLYALLYPAIVMADGHAYPRIPTFGVPCPTAILTAGFLVGAGPSLPRLLAFIPIVWAFVGGSAAFLLGVRADLVLLLAGVAMAVDMTRTGLTSRRLRGSPARAGYADLSQGKKSADRDARGGPTFSRAMSSMVRT